MPKAKTKVSKSKSSKGLVSRSKFKFDKTLVVVIAAVVVATGGYLFYKGSHAAGYTRVTAEDYGVTGSACKTYTAAYGGVYKINAIFVKAKGSTSGPGYAYVLGRNGRNIGQQTSHSYWNGQVGSLSFNASAYYGDKFWFLIFNPNNSGTAKGSVLLSPSSITNC